MLTQDYLKQLFTYDNGKLFWRVSRTNSVRIGNEAGSTRNDNGRRIINLDGKVVYAHRMIFLFHHGWLPAEIDHIDRNPSNNRIENLRSVTRAENQRNTGLRKDNTSGVKGVCWYEPTKRWTAQIRINGVRKRLGYFKNLEEAAAVMDSAYLKLQMCL
jgi:hypothetical protein